MTVREVFEMGLGFLPEMPEDNPELSKFAVKWCNMLLRETLHYENIWRRLKVIEELDEAPTVSTLEDEVPYNADLVGMAFPYGMARWIFRENDDIDGSREYYTLFVTAVKEATPLVFGEIENQY